MVSANEVEPEDKKATVIKEWPLPQSVKEVQSFLGLAGYYAHFIKDYTTLAAPLSDLLAKKITFQ